MMSFFLRLIETTDEERRGLEAIPKVHSMINHGLTRDEYAAFLHDLYHIVWHFCPIMAAAASRLGDEFRQVRYQLYHNIEEEQGHEDWVMDDVIATGGDSDAVRFLPPSPPIQAMIAFNYYTVERVHPCGVLGMLYALEVISSVYGGRVASSIARSTGYPDPGAFKFLSSHASMDLDHMANLKELVKTIHDPLAQETIVNATRTNFWLFGQLFAQPAFQAPMEMATS
jgi:pyrroloquinoline quinone (PQQ) biosynthesis protein C